MYRLYWWRKGDRFRFVLAFWPEPLSRGEMRAYSALVWAAAGAWDVDWRLNGTMFSRN